MNTGGLETKSDTLQCAHRPPVVMTWRIIIDQTSRYKTADAPLGTFPSSPYEIENRVEQNDADSRKCSTTSTCLAASDGIKSDTCTKRATCSKFQGALQRNCPHPSRIIHASFTRWHLKSTCESRRPEALPQHSSGYIARADATCWVTQRRTNQNDWTGQLNCGITNPHNAWKSHVDTAQARDPTIIPAQRSYRVLS